LDCTSVDGAEQCEEQKVLHVRDDDDDDVNIECVNETAASE